MSAAAILLTSILAAGPAVTAEAPPAPPAPPGAATVTLDAVDERAGTLLRALAKQAGWDLAIAAPQSTLDRKVTLHVEGRRPEEVAERIGELVGLEVEVDHGFLEVRPGDDDEWGGLDLDERGEHPDDRVVTGTPLRIAAGEDVHDAVSLGGPVRVEGRVRGDAAAIGGDVVLAPTAVVEGDAVAIGGTVEVQPGATLRGNQVSLGSSVGNVLSWMAQHGDELEKPESWWWSLIATALRGVTLFVFGLLLIVFAPQRVEGITRALEDKPFLSSLVGVALGVGLIPGCVLLAITVIGIPMIPVAVLLFAGLVLVGATVLAARAGALLPHGPSRTLIQNLALGVVACAVVDLIPWVGTPVLFLCALVAAGATLLSRFGTRANGSGGLQSPGGPQPAQA